MPLRDHSPREGLETRVLGDLTLPTDADRMAGLEAAYQATSKDMRALIAQMRRSQEVYAEEGIIANAGDLVIKAPPYSPNNMVCTTIIMQGPIASTSITLRLGQRIFQFSLTGLAGQPPVILRDMAFILKPDEPRTLTAQSVAIGGGDMFLWIMGKQTPEVNF